MPKLQVLVDGIERFNEDVPDAYLPERPHMFPRALGAAGTTTPGQQPTPLAKLFMLTTVIELIVTLLESPKLGPLNVEIRKRGPGCFTLVCDSPPMRLDDLA